MIEHLSTEQFNCAALLAMSEAQLQRWVIARARFHGWRVIHLRPARTNKGWRTAVQGDGAGFPDTLILRGKRLIAAELKRVGGKLTDLQDQWLNAFADTGAESYLWTPADLDDIEQVLTRRS